MNPGDDARSRWLRTWYDVLGVQPSANAAEVRAAYRRCAHELHPDLHRDLQPDDAAAGEVAMRMVNEAWSVLGDPARRAAYDRGLRNRRAEDDRADDDRGDDDRLFLGRREVRLPFTVVLLIVLFILFVVSAYAGPHPR